MPPVEHVKVSGIRPLPASREDVVPGHGPLANKARIAEYRAMLATARDRVAKLVNDGRSEQEAVAAKPLADMDAKVGASGQVSENFVRSIYHSLKPKS